MQNTWDQVHHQAAELHLEMVSGSSGVWFTLWSDLIQVQIQAVQIEHIL